MKSPITFPPGCRIVSIERVDGRVIVTRDIEDALKKLPLNLGWQSQGNASTPTGARNSAGVPSVVGGAG